MVLISLHRATLKLNPATVQQLLPALRSLSTSQVQQGGAGGFPFWLHPRFVIGKREVVGYGMNGQYEYFDRADFPFPSVRWSEPSNETLALNEKEKGDWKKMTIEEKKALYRHSFCQTFEEMHAPTGDWKVIVSAVLMAVGLAWWMWFFVQVYIWEGRKVDSQQPEAQKRQLQLSLMLHNNPVEGV